jgi:hypothetical protein
MYTYAADISDDFRILVMSRDFTCGEKKSIIEESSFVL